MLTITFLLLHPVKSTHKHTHKNKSFRLHLHPIKEYNKDERYVQSSPLEQLVLKGHVRLRLKTNAGTEDVGQGSTLLGESVDNGSARRSQRGLEHVAEDTED